MRKLFVLSALCLGLGASDAQAGCLTGAAVGGVAGHFAGHHGMLGAAAGCAIGHHSAKTKERANQANNGSATPQNGH